MRSLFFLFPLVCLLSVVALPLHGQTAAKLQARADSMRHAAQADAAVTLLPRSETADTATCTLAVHLPRGKKSDSAVQIVLTCNRLPDVVPPVLLMDGHVLEKRSESSTFQVKDGVESSEYRYHYHFYSDREHRVTCRVRNLSFGRTAYDGTLTFIAPVTSAGNDRHPFAPSAPRSRDTRSVVLPVLFLIFGLQWLLLKLRYRREAATDFAPFVLTHHRLPLTVSWASTHYGVALSLFCIAAFIVALIFVIDRPGDASRFVPPFFIKGIFVLVILGVVSWRRQSRKLLFRRIDTTLDHKALFDAIAAAGERYEWIPDHIGDDCIVCHTTPSSIFSLTWGEQIFIVYDQGCVWVNSVNDLNKRTAGCSFGYLRRNLRRVEEAIREKEKAVAEEGEGSTGEVVSIESTNNTEEKTWKTLTS